MNKQPTNGLDRRYLTLALRIAGDFGATIAAPLVVFVLGGQYLDHRFGVSPRYTVVSFILSAVLSGAMIYRKAKIYGKEFSALDGQEGKTENNI